jgi:hypothetical protein
LSFRTGSALERSLTRPDGLVLSTDDSRARLRELALRVVIGIFLERYIVKGLTAGAIK